MECLTYLLGFSLLVQVIAKDIFLNEDISLSKKAATKFLVRRKRGWWTNAAEECREGCSWEECEENSSSREGGREIMKQYKCRSYTCTSGCTNTNSNYGHINYLTVGCIVHGGWSSWGSWSSCTKSCGSGTRYHTRSCSNPSPKNGGNYCSGSTSAYASCNTHACPINGGWSSYGSYGSCSKSCGTGYKYSYRYCNNPSPAHGGKSCSGSSITSSTCNTQACPVNGVWSEWSKYSACPVTCGGGTNTRTRACDNPAPAHGGKDCDGTSSEKGACNTLACPNYCGTGPCRNGAACANIHYGYQCTCLIGFEGTNCETNIDDCVSVDCQHGGRCIDKVNAYSCECVPGYAGRHCELDINECASGPCKHGGSCTDNVNGYTCYCVPGYDGVHCETNIDECASGPCDNGGSCTDEVNGYTCTCAPGYNGVHCEIDINECASGPCEHGGSCTDEVNGYTCTCAPGYNGVHCERDINECASGPCEHGGSCTDNVNGYTCSCVPGYDGVHCEINIDECAPKPCQNGGTCTDGINEYTCTCAAGYTDNNCQTNIDECASGPCDNGGSCTDEVNGYTCTCAPGYNGVHCEIDINECASGPCEHGGSCTDEVNGYTCTCAPGYNGVHCERDINECASGPCEHGGSCTDNVNGYTCSCVPGYDGVHCEINIDECAPKPCQNGGTCTDGINEYTCTCAAGYTDNNCQTNIDECASGPCDNGGSCTDEVNGYTCTCAPGYNGVHCEIDINECASGPCEHGGSCTDEVNGYTCTCAPGYNGVHCEIDIDECALIPCKNGGSCTDGINEYSCACVPGYTGSDCEININECESDPCNNGGTCNDEVNGYSCDCAPGYMDDTCQTDIDECAPLPCENDGSCEDRVNGYHCSCVGQFYGENCQNHDGGWSIWSEFSVCSTTCGSGVQIATRDCSSPEPIGGGKNCEGEQYKTQTCSNEAECAESPFVNSDFCSGKADGFYSNQLTCDAYYVCHNGITSPMFCDHGLHWDQTNKVCNHPDNAGCTVNEQSDDTRSGYTSDMCIAKNEGDFVADPYDCSIYYRCVHGATVQLNCAEGLHWSVTLSTCAYPADANCTPMSVNGGWTDWSWSKCSVSCGSGTQTGSRSCTNPAPLHGGNACVGETTKVQECNSYLCQDGQCLTVRCDSWQYARHECEVTGLTSNSLLYKYNDCGSDPCQNGASCEDGPGTYTCTCEGYFSGINCEHRIECPEPEDVGNATMNMTGISPTDTVSYACDEYYKRKDGDMYRVCQINGEWNGTLPSCELIDCGRPEEHSTTQLQLFETGPGQVATYVCKEESPVLAAGNLTRTCLMIGEWDGQTPECMMHPEAPKFSKLIIITSSVVASVVIIIVILGALLLRQKLRTKYRKQDMGSNMSFNMVKPSQNVPGR
ncbi:Delta and Notch-like epidermal growth factor-related receptor,Delta-like protein B,Fibropellin-1,Protocadherin Fat 1,Protein jagged-1b,Protein delta homolog 2,Fibropellin-3,Coadhesin,Neurogenic locus protein delta,Protein crumbs homolog 1,Thrombospondin-2,Protein jagged-1,Protein eyes shut,Delta-like protein 3,Delta-like protein 1,Delta-like protein 4,Neurogenic locus notch homolog protein 2,Protein crumbs,Sushi, von Willebrand factor type A, EGF and pentraxin domain-containing protein 1,Protein crumbs hom|uniref:Fibropellin-1-like n=1 Tax=Mytilus edulis TaxID=6550 RepID=A0A8S3RFP0_MYTED|nr:unnamed protein product [Mytilus edulis]CAG2208150.1 Delta and Notch-like epidermal growth factor-related receptor,Delta-like protein B,Fibropellin-1,Protocadherin Fat 1,Protein jagged-1b,Protein delta homolog 2,Fibropellin-3,Coadhesin,Neurogenic locus protein delta,Protein crumbs homolog 1,Thrombospondin-2,Protein jagged-1,Protein eyes shut,Delta-like protein 3,Delta-like protein 1,Delta-like protein 4,Neurogenic locus notch homolog protein 2,Protein crumbs,Sushi, von Willebrand factor type A,